VPTRLDGQLITNQFGSTNDNGSNGSVTSLFLRGRPPRLLSMEERMSLQDQG
jgi:hypothetical protein